MITAASVANNNVIIMLPLSRSAFYCYLHLAFSSSEISIFELLFRNTASDVSRVIDQPVLLSALEHSILCNHYNPLTSKYHLPCVYIFFISAVFHCASNHNKTIALIFRNGIVLLTSYHYYTLFIDSKLICKPSSQCREICRNFTVCGRPLISHHPHRPKYQSYSLYMKITRY